MSFLGKFPGQAVSFYNLTAKLRKAITNMRDSLKERKARFEEENNALISSIRQYEEQLTTSEAELRKAILDDNLRTGNKTYPAGIQVKDFTVLEYDEAKALAWARQAGVAIKLDKTAFEKIARTSALEFVKISYEPRVQLPEKMEPILEVE